jgi:hypothetical protein
MTKNKITLTKGCIVFHDGGTSMFNTNIPRGHYIFDSIEKDDGKIGDDWISCYITKKINSGFHYYVKCDDLMYVMDKNEVKKVNFVID